MKQLLAGFILDNITEVFEKKSPQYEALMKLTHFASYFHLASKSGFEDHRLSYSPSVAVLINILQRGLPTRLNLYALEQLITRTSLFSVNKDDKSSILIESGLSPDVLKNLVYRSFHLIEPRFKIERLFDKYQQTWERLGSSFEEKFIFNSLPNSLGDIGASIVQLLAPQRSLSSIIKQNIDTTILQTRIRENFDGQRTDYSIEFPYTHNNEYKGVVIEIDGPQHQLSEQQYLDTERDRAVTSCGWSNTLRIRTSEFGTTQFPSKVRNILLPILNNDYIKNCIHNVAHPLWGDPVGKEIQQLCLIPLGVARIQRCLLELIASGHLSSKNEWKVAVLERDVPCGALAIEDLKKLLLEINHLLKDPIIIPEITLEIFATNEFINSQFKLQNATAIQYFNPSTKYDLVIDISTLERVFGNEIPSANADEIISIRSSHFIDTKRSTLTTESIKFKPFCSHEENSDNWRVNDINVKTGLEYFLKSIFRKQSFREGQLPILHNSLQCKSVIGLLPTGGGKSLTYQLSAILQPGICIVIDPIRSLMKDQVDGLLRNSIDSCVFINSTIQGEAKRKAMQLMADGEVQFVFVSPERLQMEEFRNMLDDMYSNGIYFSYCVIDEVHCVSEWGHDFRTAYLRLGENAIKHCRTKENKSIPLFGLTATASYDVLADVQRELSGNDERKKLPEDAIVRSEYTKRNELQYIIEEVTFPPGNLITIWDLKRSLGSNKQKRVIRLLTEIPETIKDFIDDPYSVYSEEQWRNNENSEQETFKEMQINNYDPSDFYNDHNAALVFCPHTRGIFGVTDKFKIDKDGKPTPRQGYYDLLNDQDSLKVGFFMGSGSENDTIAKVIQEESFENQDRFINHKLNMMVATKAFGMGIDKENIRYTIHVNYPGSIESFVQEAGRAGRDGKMALSYILFNDQEVSISTEEELIDHDLGINMYFHKNSFKGIAKELAVLDELLTEIYFPDRTFEIENLLNNKFDVEYKCNYWEGGDNKRLYVNTNDSKSLGYLDLNTLIGSTWGSIDPNLSIQIFAIIKNHIKDQNLNEPVYLWIQRSDKQVGIEEILQSKRVGETFNVTIGFFNNAKERIKTITRWLHEVVHRGFTEQVVQKMKANCTDADAFIEAICENYQKFTFGNSLDFEHFCNERDRAKGNPKGTAYKMFMALYNGYRDKMDTEKAIYRLSTLGIIDDYTVNFASNTFALKGVRKNEKEYKENLRAYLLKYYSEKTTRARLKNLDEIDEPTLIRKSLTFLVNFVYDEIKKKRELAISDMRTACRIGLEKKNVEFKDYIDLYFNSKYARAGYTYTNSAGKEVDASLSDLTNNAKNDELKLVWFFMDVVDEDPKAGQIDNIKHLRGACTRMLNNQPDSYTVLLLLAFTLYMLEYKNERYLREAEELLLHAFSSIEEKETHWGEKQIENAFNTFVVKLKDKNSELEVYMDKFGYAFDFESIMVSRLLIPLRKSTKTLKAINEILN